MVTMPWQAVIAVWWFGMFVEAAIGNFMGRVSSPNGLVGDVATIALLLAFAARRAAQ